MVQMHALLATGRRVILESRRRSTNSGAKTNEVGFKISGWGKWASELMATP
jgi:hypothetical protein